MTEIEKVTKENGDKLKDLGDRVEKVEKKVPGLEKRVEKNEKDIDDIRKIAQDALDQSSGNIKYWWAIVVAVMSIITLVIFTAADVYFAILTISAVVIVTIAAIVAYIYFRPKNRNK